MSETIKRTLDQSNGGVKVKVVVEASVSTPTNQIVDKARAFLKWASAPGQGKLDLSTSTQVTLSHVNLHMDKPKKTSEKFDIGVHAEKVSVEDQGILFNLHQTGAKFEILLREIPKTASKASNVKSKKAKAKSTA